MGQFEIINPYDNSKVGDFTFTSKAQSQEAILKLISGKQNSKNLTPAKRAQILNSLTSLMEAHKDEMAKMITLEMGKTLSDSRIEMSRAIDTINCSAEEAKRICGEVINADAWGAASAKTAMTHYFPLGLVFCITPFNFPINLAVHKIAPAFAAGNTILFKPHPQCYLSSQKLVELCYQAGMGQDMIQLICPDVPDMANIVSHEAIDCISLTGGIKAAMAITANAGMKKLLFELGGNDPLIVMEDGDINKAVDTTINQRFGTAGQRCTAAKRIFLHEDIYETFKEKLVASSNALKIGDPMQKDTFVGPVVSKDAANLAMKRIKEAIDRGAKVLLGNKQEGAIIHPTILENIDPECSLIAEETFAPIVPLIKFKNIDEVIQAVNTSSFGLQAGIFTNKLDVVKEVFSKLEVGALAVNDGPGYRKEHLPFGGVKMSGLGREGVKYAIKEMSYIKTLIL